MKLNHQKYSHFSFDLWLTLIRSNPEFKKKRNLLFKDFFEINAPLEKVTEVIRYYDVLCNNINEKTGLNLSTYEIYYLILNALDVDLSINGTEKLGKFYNETEVLFFNYKPELIFPNIKLQFEEIVEQGKSINILSNTGFIKGRSLKKLLSYYELTDFISFQIYSDEVGFSKPNNEIFQLVFDQVNESKKVSKNEVLHIGDNSIADYNGAINFGFEAHLLKS
ncbi:HAD family hydrolase [Flavobacterium aquidurense]|uniref:HAD family hydrolase n=1 Tax=Flavobacterium aquidurense TaxID=362413 RepID=UPI00091BFF45|nr:HAD family hydrolase [Flavobacterium aquidurense]OXA73673.1 phosphoglycolate phosphatase [Flavobacterium aquidurense]SHG76869.1 putative hydrolase of the HAD superfamily [Flavobacterium frigidimaris]